MKNVIMHTNGTPVYDFLSFIAHKNQHGKTLSGKKILDCGAGGLVPPLALFHQHRFDCWGIDLSDKQLSLAKQFCKEQNIELHLQEADMRHIPFEDKTFDYVYEHYSMCHLSKQDTAQAVSEMSRVLKNQGLCYLGVISADSWPKSFFGKENKPGEYVGGDEQSLHCMFTDQEADKLVSDWEILSREKRVKYKTTSEMTLEEWMVLYNEASGNYSQNEWQNRYEIRTNIINYTHLYFILKKP